jgi:hypothetical protein
VPDEKTTITELVTGLGASGVESLERALASPPRCLVGVSVQAWEQLRLARQDRRHDALFTIAWDNGRAFFEARDGLRRRRPVTIEWKGPHKPPGYDSLPADLRIDHVFLVSCKYGSDIAMNCSPSNLVDRLLADRARDGEPWFSMVAPAAYGAFYRAVRTYVGSHLPGDVAALRSEDIAEIRESCERRWPGALVEPWRDLSNEIANATAARWNANLPTAASRELMLWRLLRLETAPYFVLGTTKGGEPIRYRVATPWDWRQAFTLRSFDVKPKQSGQPLVAWRALVRDRQTGDDREIVGEVEVRWSHGRFSSVEAKLHLVTPPGAVPGYFPLVATRRASDGDPRLPGLDD